MKRVRTCEKTAVCMYLCVEMVILWGWAPCQTLNNSNPLIGASLSERLMAQRESISTITLVICQSCWAVERMSHSYAVTIFTTPPTFLLLLFLILLCQPMAGSDWGHVPPLFPPSVPLWSTAERWHPFQKIL